MRREGRIFLRFLLNSLDFPIPTTVPTLYCSLVEASDDRERLTTTEVEVGNQQRLADFIASTVQSRLAAATEPTRMDTESTSTAGN